MPTTLAGAGCARTGLVPALAGAAAWLPVETLAVAAALALALGCGAGAASAPTPRARAEPVAAIRSAALIGFLPSSMTAAAEVGGTGAAFALGAATAEVPEAWTPEAVDVVVGPLAAFGAAAAAFGAAVATLVAAAAAVLVGVVPTNAAAFDTGVESVDDAWICFDSTLLLCIGSFFSVGFGSLLGAGFTSGALALLASALGAGCEVGFVRTSALEVDMTRAGTT